MEGSSQTPFFNDVDARRGPFRQALLHDARPAPVRHRRVGAARRAHRPRRPRRLRAARRRVPEDVVAERDEHRRPEVLPRPARLADARALRQADDRPRRGHDRRLGPLARVLRVGRGRRHLRVRARYILVHQMAAFNSPVWFNVGFEESPQCACVLHPQRRGHDGVDPRLEHQGGQDLPRRLGLGHQPLEHPRLDGAADQGRHRVGPRVVHARRRLVGRHDQVRRQDAPRGEDGRARHRPPGHPRVHLVQGQGGEEGQRAARRRLRHVDRRRGLPLDPVPERQQLGAADRRLHARRRARRGLAPHRPHDRRAGRRPDPRARAHARDRRGRVAVRRSGRAVRHDDQPVAHVPGVGAHQRVQPVLASTCTSTTRPATSRR